MTNLHIGSAKSQYIIPSTTESVGEAQSSALVSLPLLFGLHTVLGILLFLYPQLSTLHTLFTLALGVIWATTRPSVFAAYAVAYIAGSEVLWRMTEARFFWEGGKYASILILGLSIFQDRRKTVPRLPLLYFVFLLPSITLTLSKLGLSEARAAVSFNLSGPLLLFFSAWFFSGLRLSIQQLRNLLLALIFPMIAIVVYAFLIILSNPNIVWVNDSMFQTSGGFGPNQVSTVMGLGVLAVWSLVIVFRLDIQKHVLLSLIGIMLSVQAFLTFSRGGVWVAVITALFVSAHSMSEVSRRLKALRYLLLVVSIFAFLIPALNDISQGAFETRFTDDNLTHRDVLLKEEFQLFLDNPITGVGPGGGNEIRHAASHTEYTRMLGEHGILGAISLGLLFLMTVRHYFGSRNNLVRGIKGSFMLWSLLAMTNVAMRLASISFVFGLGFTEIDLDDTN